ncbi:hypothetical protein L484_015186 [Morus notabilis]|uniref:Uncharacterized protein n=1 Tax=Morus notabilis TaxID=981085 RepID=W9S330_9ROSA|nr:hypothetical protein L484_015186 [Morus notabilis]
MSFKQNPDVEDQAKKTAMANTGEDVMSPAEAELMKQPEPRFKQKMGSVFPRKRRSVKKLMFDYVRLQLGSTSAPADTSQIVVDDDDDDGINHTNCCFNSTSSAALFPEEASNAIKAKRVYPNIQKKHGN